MNINNLEDLIQKLEQVKKEKGNLKVEKAVSLDFEFDSTESYLRI